MVDVLVYLYETYGTPTSYPDTNTLVRKLSAIGFEDDDIAAALQWLGGLAHAAQNLIPAAAQQDDSVRVYHANELEWLGTENLGFLSFLESAGVFSPLLRELIIDRTLATGERPVSLSLLKVIILMVLWSQETRVDSLILEELLDDGGARQLH